MLTNNRKKPAASLHALPNSLRETSAGEEVPSTGVDSDQLLQRLGALAWELHGQSAGVAERLCQEIIDASQGHVRLVLLCDPRLTQTPSYHEHARLFLAVEYAGRSYGNLEITPDPIRPDQPVLPYQKMQMVASQCTLILYNLEAAAYFQREYPSPVSSSAELTPREQQILELLCRGYQRKQIAPMLHIKPGTVAKTCGTLYAQLGVRSEREAIAAAFRLGIFSPIENLALKVKLPPTEQEI